MTDTAKVKKGKVGGDDVGSKDTERLEPDNEQWLSVLLCVGGWVQQVCVYEREIETERAVLEVDPGSRGPAGL